MKRRGVEKIKFGMVFMEKFRLNRSDPTDIEGLTRLDMPGYDFYQKPLVRTCYSRYKKN